MHTNDCNVCGIGNYLPSGRCDHCNHDCSDSQKALRTELHKQMMEAWMRQDYTTAHRIAKLIGEPSPLDHELADIRPAYTTAND